MPLNLSPEAARVASHEYLFYGHSAPLDRIARFLALQTDCDGESFTETDETPSQWEAMLSRM